MDHRDGTSSAAAAAVASADGPKVETVSCMKVAVCVPVSLINAHMPEVEEMQKGVNRPLRIQLVLLPPYATDITPSTPAKQVIEFRHGITVRKTEGRSRGTLRPNFVLSGLPLKRSEPVEQGWYLRGVRCLGRDYVQLLCSPELPPELAVAKEALETQRQQWRRQTTQARQDQQQQQHQQQQNYGIKTGAKPVTSDESGEDMSIDGEDDDKDQYVVMKQLDEQEKEDGGNMLEKEGGQLQNEPEAAAAAAHRRCSQPPAAAATGAGAAARAGSEGNAGSLTTGPRVHAVQQMNTAVCIPRSLVNTHMPELAAMAYNSNKAIAVQVVMLPPHAEDVTPETPAQQVVELRHGIQVRKSGQGSNRGDVYTLSGLPLRQSLPVKEAWWLRGVRVLGELHIQLLCSHELPPELLEAKQQIEASKKQKREEGKQLQQQQARQQRWQQEPAGAAGRGTSAAGLRSSLHAAATKSAVAGAPGTPAAATAAARATPRQPELSSSVAGVSTDGPYASVMQRMDKIMYVPSSLANAHIDALADMEIGTSNNVTVQLVMLPPHAADVTPETPAQRVIELRHGVSVRKFKQAKYDGVSYVISGLPLSRSQPAMDGWWIRGVRYLGGLHLQLLVSPELPPEVLEAKLSAEASRQQKRNQAKALQQEQERQEWAEKLTGRHGRGAASLDAGPAGAAPCAAAATGSARRKQQQPQRIPAGTTPAALACSTVDHASPTAAGAACAGHAAVDAGPVPAPIPAADGIRSNGYSGVTGQQLPPQRQQQQQQQKRDHVRLRLAAPRSPATCAGPATPAAQPDRGQAAAPLAAAAASAAAVELPHKPHALAFPAAAGQVTGGSADLTVAPRLVKRGKQQPQKHEKEQHHQQHQQQSKLQEQHQQQQPGVLSGFKRGAEGTPGGCEPVSKCSRLASGDAAPTATQGAADAEPTAVGEVDSDDVTATSPRAWPTDVGMESSRYHWSQENQPDTGGAAAVARRRRNWQPSDHQKWVPAFQGLSQRHMDRQWLQQQFQQQQQQQHYDSQMLPYSWHDRHTLLMSHIHEVVEHWHMKPRAHLCCGFWSGTDGSCKAGDACRYVRSHVPDLPTPFYLERAEWFKRFGVPRDATGCYHPAKMQAEPRGWRLQPLPSRPPPPPPPPPPLQQHMSFPAIIGATGFVGRTADTRAAPAAAAATRRQLWVSINSGITELQFDVSTWQSWLPAVVLAPIEVQRVQVQFLRQQHHQWVSAGPAVEAFVQCGSDRRVRLGGGSLGRLLQHLSGNIITFMRATAADSRGRHVITIKVCSLADAADACATAEAAATAGKADQAGSHQQGCLTADQLQMQVEKLASKLETELEAVNKDMDSYADVGGCPFWSGIPGSCGQGKGCRLSRSHIPAKPSPSYLARAAVYETCHVSSNQKGTFPTARADCVAAILRHLQRQQQRRQQATRGQQQRQQQQQGVIAAGSTGTHAKAAIPSGPQEIEDLVGVAARDAAQTQTAAPHVCICSSAASSGAVAGGGQAASPAVVAPADPETAVAATAADSEATATATATAPAIAGAETDSDAVLIVVDHPGPAVIEIIDDSLVTCGQQGASPTAAAGAAIIKLEPSTPAAETETAATATAACESGVQMPSGDVVPQRGNIAAVAAAATTTGAGSVGGASAGLQAATHPGVPGKEATTAAQNAPGQAGLGAKQMRPAAAAIAAAAAAADAALRQCLPQIKVEWQQQGTESQQQQQQQQRQTLQHVRPEQHRHAAASQCEDTSLGSNGHRRFPLSQFAAAADTPAARATTKPAQLQSVDPAAAHEAVAAGCAAASAAAEASCGHFNAGQEQMQLRDIDCLGGSKPGGSTSSAQPPALLNGSSAAASPHHLLAPAGGSTNSNMGLARPRSSGSGGGGGGGCQADVAAAALPVSPLLEELGLQQFAPVFVKEMVLNVEVLSQMTREDYRHLGVPTGAMLMIMKRCQELVQQQ